MSDDGVYPGEMDAPHDFEFDDDAAEALLSGSRCSTDPQLADLFDDMRVAYTSQPPAVGADLAAVLVEADVTTEASPTRRFERMRSSLVARAGAAAAAMVAATGGLAVAHALPASMQDAASEIGIGAPAHHGHHAHDTLHVTPDESTPTIEHATTTVPEHENQGVEGDDNDGDAVAGGHAGDNDDQGENECEADERDEVEHDDDAVTPTTAACMPTTETTAPESHDGNPGDTNDDNEHSTVTTVPETHDGEHETTGSPGSGDDRATTPTASHSDGGGDSHSGSGDGGSSNDG